MLILERKYYAYKDIHRCKANAVSIVTHAFL